MRTYTIGGENVLQVDISRDRSGRFSAVPAHAFHLVEHVLEDRGRPSRTVVATGTDGAYGPGMDVVAADDPNDRPDAAPAGLTSHFWAIFTRSANPMLLANNRREYVDANAAAVEMLGYPREELMRLRIEDLTPPEHLDTVEEAWAGFLAEGTAVGEYEVVRADGTRLTAEYNATAYVLPGLHLSIFLQEAEADDGGEIEVPEDMLLTPREREVLERVALGESSAEVAEHLVISPETVRQHVQNTLHKLGARTRAQAIGIALRTGQLD